MGGHSKEMMRSKKNKPSRSALLASDLWQDRSQQSLSHAQNQAQCPRMSSQGSSSPSGTHRGTALIHLGRPGLHKTSEGCVRERRGEQPVLGKGGNPFLGFWISV